MTSLEENTQEIVANSRMRKQWCIINILDSKNNDIVITTITGEIIGGSLNIVSGQDGNLCRRSGQMTLRLISKLVEDYYIVSLRNKVQIFIQIQDSVTGIIGTFNMGYYWMNNPKVNMNNTEMTIELVDLMSEFTTEYGSQIGFPMVIEQGDTLVNVINKITRDEKLMGLLKVKIIDDDNLTIPYDLEFDSDNSLTDVLKKILELYMGYEIFFDNEGIFTFQKIQDYTSDYPIEIYKNSPMIINISENKNFSNVKNIIVVWGMCVESSSDINEPYQYTYTSTNDNPNHPLSTYNIPKKLYSKTNDNFQSIEQCKLASEYYLDKYSNYAETITLEILPNPRLQPNKVIKIDLKKDDVKIKGKYLIDSLGYDLSYDGLQTIVAHKLYNPKQIVIDGGYFGDIRSNVIVDGGSFTDNERRKEYDGGCFKDSESAEYD